MCAIFIFLRFQSKALLIAAFVLAFAPLMVRAETQNLQISSPYAFMIDAETQSVLYEKDPDALVTPASTAKIMTAEIVFRELTEGRLKLDQQLIVSENAWREGGAPSHGSSMFAIVNKPVPVEDLIRGLVIVSANDAAITLAETVAGSEGAFASLMTKRAHELGLNHLTFTNAWGRGDPEQKVTPREMTALARHVIDTYPDFYKYFGEHDFTWNKIKQPNRNPLLTMDIGADGLKTGNIDNSGYGIVVSAVQNGQRLILALYGAKSSKERNEDARRLLQWGFRSFESKEIFQKDEIVGNAKVFGGAFSNVPLTTNNPVKILMPRNSPDKYTGKITYLGPLIAPVQQGMKVADLKIYRGGSEVLDVPLKTADSIAMGSLYQRAFDGVLEKMTVAFRKFLPKP